jgi:hypothetical protein
VRFRHMSRGPPEDKSKSPWRPGRQRRRGVYFRVEIYDQTSLCWRDAPGTFGSIREASDFIAQQSSGRPARVMKIDGRRRTVVQ